MSTCLYYIIYNFNTSKNCLLYFIGIKINQKYYVFDVNNILNILIII
jgi:hypothetical protein